MASQVPTMAQIQKKTMSPSDLVLFPTPILAIKGAICFCCLQAPAEGQKLDRCKGCKRVSYCSYECQKQDWKKAHKNVCPVLQGINKLDAPCEPRTWEDYRGDMWMRIDAFRDQPKELKINDERILQYQPHCGSCHRNTFQLPTNANKLTLCQTCLIAHHCNTCTHSTHYQICRTYTHVATCERFAINHFLTSLQPNITLFTLAPRKSYIPLSQAKSWRDYYTVLSDQGSHLAPLLTDVLDPVAVPKDAENAKKMNEMSGALKAGTDKLSMMLTILSALEAIFPALATKEKITLHVIGATTKELDALMLFEELLHLLPALKNLHVDFVGLELPRPVDAGIMTIDCCEPCSNAKRTRSVTMFKGSYVDFMRSRDVFRGPDLAVLFHTGHSQEAVESWKPTIRYLAHAPIPSLFTCYNKKEMEEETQGLVGVGAKFVVEGKRNRWSGLRPLLEVAEETEGTVFYMNEYWYVVAGEKK